MTGSWKWTAGATLAVLAMIAAGCATKPRQQEDTAAPPPAEAGTETTEALTGFQPIQSETIYSINYDQDSQVLTVVLYEEGVYDYQNVPLNVYERFLSADDHDAYYQERVANTYEGIKFEVD